MLIILKHSVAVEPGGVTASNVMCQWDCQQHCVSHNNKATRRHKCCTCTFKLAINNRYLPWKQSNGSWSYLCCTWIMTTVKFHLGFFYACEYASFRHEMKASLKEENSSSPEVFSQRWECFQCKELLHMCILIVNNEICFCLICEKSLVSLSSGTHFSWPHGSLLQQI